MNQFTVTAASWRWRHPSSAIVSQSRPDCGPEGAAGSAGRPRTPASISCALGLGIADPAQDFGVVLAQIRRRQDLVLYVLTGIEPPDGGQVRWGEVELTTLPESGRDRWRRHQVGMIFQDFHLFEGLTPLQNVLLPLSFERTAPGAEARDRAQALLAEVGVPEDRTDIALMSRGERQRIAIARALLHTPDILAVDEPTASLDAEASEAVIELLLGRCRAAGVTLLAVTHDAALIQRLDEVHRLVDGRLQAQAGRAA